jgi:hypothetical protein
LPRQKTPGAEKAVKTLDIDESLTESSQSVSQPCDRRIPERNSAFARCFAEKTAKTGAQSAGLAHFPAKMAFNPVKQAPSCPMVEMSDDATYPASQFNLACAKQRW